MKIREEEKIQFISSLLNKKNFSGKRLWPTIFHDSQNFVIIIDGYENVERSEGWATRTHYGWQKEAKSEKLMISLHFYC